MKKILALIFTLVILATTFTGYTYAHPGAYSRDGCYYCRTNCKKWGYTYGTRHCKAGKVPKFGIADPLYYGKKR